MSTTPPTPITPEGRIADNPIRRGWRTFECPDCSRCWEEATRDCFSPSKSECPCEECGWSVSPTDGRVDADLPCDSMGNLTMPWSERVRVLP